jgi:hypothetical protein
MPRGDPNGRALGIQSPSGLYKLKNAPVEKRDLPCEKSNSVVKFENS